MKKIIYFFIIANFFCLSSNGQDTLASTHPIVMQLKSMNFSQYIGQPVDSLIAHLPSGYTEMKIRASIVAKQAGYLVVKYAPRTYVYIAVRQFSHMNPKLSPTGDPLQNWDLSLFRMENLSFALAYNAGNCFNGCEHVREVN